MLKHVNEAFFVNAHTCTVDPPLSEHLWSPIQFKPFGKLNIGSG